MPRREDERTTHLLISEQRARRTPAKPRKPPKRWTWWRAFKEWFFIEEKKSEVPPAIHRDVHEVRNEYDPRYEGDRRVD